MELRDKIIDSAYNLLSEKGYENTTITDIINEAGCSKGGFYHHFKSKEEIVEAITMDYIKVLRRYYEDIILESNGSVIDLLNNIIMTINRYKEEKIQEWPKLTKIFAFSGNHVVISKLAHQFELVTTEFYTKLFLLGIENGLFEIKYPEFLAGVWTREILRLYSMANQVLYLNNSEDIKKFERLLDFIEDLFNSSLGFTDRIIKIRESTLTYVDKGRKKMSEMKKKFE